MNDFKSKIYGKLALYSLRNVGKDLQNAEKDSKKFIEDVKTSLSSGGKASFDRLEEKAKHFYDSLPEASKNHYQELMKELNELKAEIKNLAEEKIKTLQETYNEELY
ncbi:hypothetical protein [Flavobacterium branchiicola]|uniref:Uncharacterized protein n=1 Tax=Flavobacterium branchiicola TaxID=1114875 RepID=A0ABV9P6F0_9FLAO|nr:hypothetical protein [Flavobacterium branchiicola]MBS7253006.1 hypothetical protein [Flavobacterium branchiicola]